MKITDEYILRIFYTKNGVGPLNSQYKRKLDNNVIIISKEIDQQIRNYLTNYKEFWNIEDFKQYLKDILNK